VKGQDEFARFAPSRATAYKKKTPDTKVYKSISSTHGILPKSLFNKIKYHGIVSTRLYKYIQ